MFGEWRKRGTIPKVHVTKDTIVPEKPKRILTEPDDVAYHMKIAEIDEKVEALNVDIKDINATFTQERNDMIDGQQARNPIKKELSEQFAELKIFSDKKVAILAKIESIESQIKDLNKQRDKLRQQVHPIYNDAGSLAAGVKALERRLTTESLDRYTELKIVKEIEQVKKSQPLFDEIDKLTKKMEAKKAEKQQASVELPELSKVIKKIKTVIDSIKEREKVFVDDKTTFSGKIAAIKKKRDDKYTEIRLLRNERNLLKEDFYF
jgi:chromosome segregation ATPase